MDHTIVAKLIRTINDNYQNQLSKYQEILDLSLKCRQVSEQDELDDLLELIAAKHKIIKTVEGLNAELIPQKEELTRLLGIKQFVLSQLQLDFPEQEEAELLSVTIGKLSGVLEQLSCLEQENENVLRARFMGVDQESAEKNQKQNFQTTYGLSFSELAYSGTIDKRK